MSDFPLKRCTKCKRELPETTEYFGKNAGGKSLQSVCKHCVYTYQRYHAKHGASTEYKEKQSDKEYLASQDLKRCARCETTYPLSDEHFSTHPRYTDGFYPYCKTCRAYLRKNQRPELLERDRARSRQYRVKNPEKKRAMDKKYQMDNAERIRQHRKKTKHRSNALRRARGRIDPTKHRVSNNKRLARKLNLPDTLTAADWQRALDYFGGFCAVCGRPPGLWHTLAMDHWIPLSSLECPGTIPANIVPLCHSRADGENGCNNTKLNKDPIEWLIARFGKRKAGRIIAKVRAYFDSL